MNKKEPKKCIVCGGDYPRGSPSKKCPLHRDVWAGDKLFEQLTNNGTRRKRMIAEIGHHCEVCKNTEWNGLPIPLEADHIDGDHENRKRSNFRLICPNCHAQTPTYKGKNGRRKYAPVA